MHKNNEVELTNVQLNNDLFYKISNVHHMRHFFMTIVSDSNHWLFLSSNGGISAGRKNAEYALFPYYTDDKITDTAEVTGSKTIIRLLINNELSIWEPFSVRSEATFNISRNIYQSCYSNKIIFEEINHTIGLSFKYEWNTSNIYGFIKKSSITNLSSSKLSVEVLDGLQNVLPFGIPSELQIKTSNLADAYKRTELVSETGLGLFALSAIIVDKAEPSEALKTNAVWQIGCEKPTYLLSTLQLTAFRKGENLLQEEDVKAEKGAYFTVSALNLEENETKSWMYGANVNLNHGAIALLNKQIKTDDLLVEKINADIELGTQNLISLCAAADAIQITSDNLKDSRHFSNVLFNIMRGGIFDNNYEIEKVDFERYLKKANKETYELVINNFGNLSNKFSVHELKSVVTNSNNTNFTRLATEYLPLKFSRRHGDPSRPWNQFSINTIDETTGSKVLDYQGNWRDIFQNWEALAHAYPAFIEGMICKFLNATTFEGYNPYRVTKDGFDWETIEADNPWSYIGYWGDHQIIYLLKFLEFANEHQFSIFESFFQKNVFVYANVPYTIKNYESIVIDPKNTIDFDYKNEKNIHQKIALIGADGALLTTKDNHIYNVGFLEKILATVLSKLSNLVPEGGIWMNTQRPEWNDANNALVGNGLSMVTLYYLRRFLSFFNSIITKSKAASFEISTEQYAFFSSVFQILDSNKSLLSTTINKENKKAITDALGLAASNFRNSIYTNQFSGKKDALTKNTVINFIEVALLFIDHSIKANKRSDNLYHSYNLLNYSSDGITIAHLSEMLEGQVAVLSSKFLTAEESCLVLDSLQKSELYRKDQNSYILYPNKQLNGFLQKNNIPVDSLKKSKLLLQLIEENNNDIVEKDVDGNYHFNGNFKNAADIQEALKKFVGKYASLIESEQPIIQEIFEEIFNHKAFTGRSGTFYAYEGLGSIYWHMVSKLALAVQETCLQAIQQNAPTNIVHKLITHYYNVSDGIGVHKTPTNYGAFPITPYSHTPAHRGAQQPGMTGQVKEDILCRLGELGVFIQESQLNFNPTILKKTEFLVEPKKAHYVNIFAEKQEIFLPANALLFTFCQVPVVYLLSNEDNIEISYKNGSTHTYIGTSINKEDSLEIFNRTGNIIQIVVKINESHFNQ